MPGDLELQTERSGRLRAGSSYDKAIDRYAAARKARAEAEERRRLAEAQARQEAMLQGQQLAAQARRQEQEHAYGMQSTAQRANINADAANMDHVYTTQRDQSQQKGIQKRDQLLAGYDKETERRKALDQQIRDQRQFGFQTDENNQKFGQQLKRDEVQQQYSTQSEQQQHYNTLDRDASQFGFDTQRENQQQGHTLQRDAMQFGQQMQRDEYQNQYSMQRDEQQQQYAQQNMYQRETADIAARWNEQVQTARNSGLDFSPRQQQEMKELDAAFRKNVMNSDLDEGLKQQAMLMHQKKLAAIIPEDKVQDPKAGLDQSVIFHEPTGTWFMQGRDSRGNPTYEPLGTGGGGGPDPAKEQAAQKKEQQQQAEKIRKAMFDREDRWDALINDISTRLNADETGPLYDSKTPEGQAEIEKQARKEFASKEKYYRDLDNLPPHDSFQREADAERQKMEKEMQKLEQEQLKQQRAEQKRQQTSQYDVQRKPATTPQATENPYRQKLEQTAQPKPIVFSYKTPVSPEIRQQLKERTGSDELYNIREKHKSNSVEDQTIRLASEILMKALLTNDMSDPDLAESIETLRTRAGLKME